MYWSKLDVLDVERRDAWRSVCVCAASHLSVHSDERLAVAATTGRNSVEKYRGACAGNNIRFNLVGLRCSSGNSDRCAAAATRLSALYRTLGPLYAATNAGEKIRDTVLDSVRYD